MQQGENSCPPGFEPNKNFTFLCQGEKAVVSYIKLDIFLAHQSFSDTNECKSGMHSCAASEICVNENGGYRCETIKSNDISDESSESEEDDANYNEGGT